MRAAGCDTVVDAKDLAVVGITEILNHLPFFARIPARLIGLGFRPEHVRSPPAQS